MRGVKHYYAFYGTLSSYYTNDGTIQRDNRYIALQIFRRGKLQSMTFDHGWTELDIAEKAHPEAPPKKVTGKVREKKKGRVAARPCL